MDITHAGNAARDEITVGFDAALMGDPAAFGRVAADGVRLGP
jgi:hypothetical protein